MAVVMFYACYLPAITYSVWRSNTFKILHKTRLGFLFGCFLYVYLERFKPYHLRITKQKILRSHQATGKRSFGSSSFQEKPVKNNRREKRGPEHVSKLRKGEEPGASTAREETHERGVGDGNFATSQLQ